jgi:hypothetical protein
VKDLISMIDKDKQEVKEEDPKKKKGWNKK